MVDGLVYGGVAAVAVLVGVSAFFSSSESAVFSLPVDETTSAGDDERAATLAELRSDPHRLLVTLLVGNNVVNVAIASITTLVVASLLPPGPAVAAATVLASVVVLVFGEIVPKSYGLGNARRWSLTVARPIAVLELLLFPVVYVFDLVTRRITAAIGGDREIEDQYLSN